jgi:hypothetical protein
VLLDLSAHSSRQVRFCYADPPYPGQARKGYGGTWASRPSADRGDVAEVDHAALVADLEVQAYDGWALSTSSSALAEVLRVCPPTVRVMAWVKPFASFKPNVNPGYCWEPVIVMGGRKLGRHVPTVRDYVSANVALMRGTVGAKPKAFCWWLFMVLGMQKGDVLVDQFPGSGAVMAAWESYQRSGQADLFEPLSIYTGNKSTEELP